MWCLRPPFARRSGAPGRHSSAYLPTMETPQSLTRRSSEFGSDAQTMALKQLMQITHRQGVVMAFGGVISLPTLLFGGSALAAMLVRKPAPTTAAPTH